MSAKRIKNKPAAVKPEQSPPRSQAGIARAFPAVLLLSSAVFIVFRIITPWILEPGSRVWGFDYHRYLDSWDIWLAIAAPLIACFPPVASRLSRWFEDKPKKRSPFMWGAAAFTLTAAVLLLSHFYPVLYSFLGDGSYCHAEVFRVKSDPGYPAGLFDKPTAYLTGQALRYIATAFDFADNRYPFQLLSGIGAVILIPGLFALLYRSKRSVLLLFLSVLTGGVVSLFYFGYIELYTLQYTFLVLFFAAGYRSIAENRSAALPFVLLLISIGFGGSSIAYLPAAIVLWLVTTWNASPRLPNIVVGLIALEIAAFIALFLLQWDDMRSQYLIPFVSGNITREDGVMTGWYGYSMLSLPHLIDIVNAIALTNGLIVVMAIASLKHLFERSIWKEPLLQFSAVSALSGSFLLLGGYSSFGLARDWDIAAIAIAGIAAFCLSLLLVLDERKKINLAALAPVILLFSIGSAYSWIALNHSEASALRLEHQIDRDAQHLQPVITYSGYENLRKYYASHKRDADRARILPKMVTTGWHTFLLCREGITLAFYLPSQTQCEKELDWYFGYLLKRLEMRLPKNHYMFIPRRQIEEFIAASLLDVNLGKPELTNRYMDMILSQAPGFSYTQFLRVTFDPAIPPPLKASRLERAVPLDVSSAPLLARMADYLRFAGDFQKSAEYYERALAVEAHDYPGLYIILSDIYVQKLGDVPKAVSTLQRCADSCLLAPERPMALERLNALKNALNSQ